MESKSVSMSRKVSAALFAVVLVGVVTMSPVVAQTPPSCTEDFTSDSDASVSGFANSIFVHGVTSQWALGNGFPGESGHSLWLFAGATDPITFPGQTVTSARVRIFAYGTTFVIFEGAGDILTARFNPAPFAQVGQAVSTTVGDNGQPLGQITRITLRGFETQFDDVEISPCGITPQPSAHVDVLVRPRAVNPRRNDGVMKAVILTDADFDATTVDAQTVQFGNATVPFTSFPGDEDEDGDTDLIFFFLVGDVGIQCGDTSVPLTGQTLTGQAIDGEGTITTVGCP